MQKLSLKTVVIILPLVAAIGLAWMAMQRREAARTSERMFKMQVREGRLLEVHRIFRDLSPERAEALLQTASESPWICYDDDVRLAQIQKGGLIWENGPQDLLALASLKEPRRWRVYQFPINAKVVSASFEDGVLSMNVCGRIADGIEVPANNPLTIHLPWPRGSTKPPRPRIETMLMDSWQRSTKSRP